MKSPSRLKTSVAQPVKLFFDASVRIEDESTAIGFVLETFSGEKLVTKGVSTQYMANTQAEYQALVKALETAANYPGIEHIRIHGDCKSVIDVLDPDNKATANYVDIRKLVESAKDVLSEFEFAELRYISRDENEDADELARLGHAKRVTTLPDPYSVNKFSLPRSRNTQLAD